MSGRARRPKSDFVEMQSKEIPWGKEHSWRCAKCGIYTVVNLKTADAWKLTDYVALTKCRCTMKGDIRDFDFFDRVKRVNGDGPERGVLIKIDRIHSLLQMKDDGDDKWWPANDYTIDWD